MTAPRPTRRRWWARRPWPAWARPAWRSWPAWARPAWTRPAWRPWTLRARLAAALILLSAVGLVAANAAGVVLLRTYLVDQVDERLTAMGHRAARGTPPPAGRDRAGTLGADVALYFYGADGVLAGRSEVDPALRAPTLPDYPALRARAATGRPFTVAADGTWRAVARSREGGGVVVLAASLREVAATTRSLLLIDAAAGGVVLVALGLVGFWVVRIGLSPLTRMGEVAARITVGDLSRRVPGGDPHTEPGRLGATLNGMLARLEAEVAARAQSEHRLRRFLGDASHELRTPLTSIRGFAELYRRGGAPPGPALDETIGRIEDEAVRMGLLVDDLLLLARLDVQRPMARERVDLTAVVADTVRDARARAPQRTVRLEPVAGDLGPVLVDGDEHRLRQVAANLVDNALRHAGAHATVTVRVGSRDAPTDADPPDRPDGPVAVLEVSDTGVGIAPAHADRVFERLYRVDASRTRSLGGGAGLGLAIVSAIVHGHGGTVALDSTPGRGATFRVLLPAADTDDS
ncbi:putative sensor histidine kinase PhoR [Pilimelia terevasa]|uniref:histidine kinase n=1 Tax=Pilimelia terevasa TaxID=53372 RepID=A0A8J3BID2_9ACTN|nr:HAMP domain-containing sensor histidine kinase [Pilimelia terevasa]GGK16947.1 putative sensor histidine kinase PhoR [Pilimelia terevasa]